MLAEMLIFINSPLFENTPQFFDLTDVTSRALRTALNVPELLTMPQNRSRLRMFITSFWSISHQGHCSISYTNGKCFLLKWRNSYFPAVFAEQALVFLRSLNSPKVKAFRYQSPSSCPVVSMPHCTMNMPAGGTVLHQPAQVTLTSLQYSLCTPTPFFNLHHSQ